MWRNLSRRASMKKLKSSADSFSIFHSYSSVKFFERLNFLERIRPSEAHPSEDSGNSFVGFLRIGGLFPRIDQMGMFNFSCSRNPFSISSYARDLGSVAEAIDSTEEEDSDEIQELIEEMNKVTKDESSVQQAKQPKLIGGMGPGKYHMLRRRQLKMETEAWQEAAKEYQELLADMCEQKLAPNLPYMKSLFLGWFEPLRDAIVAEQERCKTGRNVPAYGPYFGQLPADMMTVITMHKLMALLMTGGGNGSARVIQAASHVGEAVELEALTTSTCCQFEICTCYCLTIGATNTLSDSKYSV
ncbi:male gametophyte defective 3 [Actinidia rufa]|uniref:Male gametophyte defective 3 n=1 Tax=Actinidia rufa TaxID=165716 RepID=A0A7J0H5H3_9ERIC|nr:male gametophyte defective 3 [Actinidia rufa]